VKLTRSCAILLTCAIGVAGLARAQPQPYPARPITVMSWVEPGSALDIFARTIARHLSRELGQNTIVENRPGADGIILINYLLKQPADGYTLAVNTNTLASHFSEPAPTFTFKPEDLQMVARSQIDPYSLVVPGESPFKSLDDVIKAARSNPNKLNIGGGLQLSGLRVFWEIFSELGKIETNWIAYKGSAPTMTAVVGRQVDAAILNPGLIKQMVTVGKLRIIAVSADSRLTDFPEIPTFRELGWNVVRYQWRGVMTKAGLPQATLDKLTEAIRRSQQTPEWKAYLKQESITDGFLNAAEFKSQLMQDTAETQAIRKRLGL